MPVHIPIVVARSVMTEKQVKEILAKADKNKDYCITMCELRNAVKEIGSRWPCFRAYLFLQTADFNGDGKISGKAEMDKLVALILNWYYQKYS